MFNKMSEYQFATRLVFIIALFVFLGEVLVMILMPFLPFFSSLLSAFIDASFLIIILSPVLYFGLFRSSFKIIEQLRHVEKELRKHRDHLEDLVKERTTEIAMLLEGSRAVLQHREFEMAATIIYEKCKETIGAQAGYIALLDNTETENEIWFQGSSGLLCTVDQLFPIPVKRLRNKVLEKGEVLFDNNFPETKWPQLIPQENFSCENGLFAPLIIDKKPVGLLCLVNKTLGFNDNDARIATTFAEFASISLFNSCMIESLTTSEERFRSVVETAMDSIIALNSKAHVIFWNQSAEKMFGYTSDEILGKPVTKIIPQKFHKVHKNSLKRVRASRKFNLAEKVWRHKGLKKDGGEFPLELSLASWKTSEGIFFTVIIRDISDQIKAERMLKAAKNNLENQVVERTQKLLDANLKLKNEIEERKFAEAELQKNKAMLQAIFDGISEPLILVDKQMHIKIMNKRACEYYEIPDYRDVNGKVCYEARRKSGPCVGCHIPSAISSGNATTFERKNLDHPDRIEQIVIYPIKDNNDKMGDSIIRVTDVTEAKKFERVLIHSEKMASLGVLVSSVAHEINNPNNFVTFNIPILREYVQEMLPITDTYADTHPDLELCHMTYPQFRADIFKLLDNVEHGSARISSFVSNLRAFAQSNGLKSFSWVDLVSLSEKVLSICQNKIRKTIKSFVKEVPEKLPKIYTDTYALEQVLINLLLNAVQAVDKPDSWVKLKIMVTDEWKDHTIIQISDNGCGIDKKIQSKIFDPFFTTKLPTEGTGLGLYVCHNMIQGLGGRIDVQSKPGEGSEFTVILPDKERRRKPRK